MAKRWGLYGKKRRARSCARMYQEEKRPASDDCMRSCPDMLTRQLTWCPIQDKRRRGQVKNTKSAFLPALHTDEDGKPLYNGQCLLCRMIELRSSRDPATLPLPASPIPSAVMQAASVIKHDASIIVQRVKEQEWSMVKRGRRLLQKSQAVRLSHILYKFISKLAPLL